MGVRVSSGWAWVLVRLTAIRMLPYQAMAMDYASYQRQANNGPPTGPPGPPHPSMLSMSMGGPSFTHSWLVPPQDLCAVPYKQMPNQHPNSAMPSNQQLIEPGHVSNPMYYNFTITFNTTCSTNLLLTTERP